MELLMRTHPATYPRHDLRILVDPRPDEIPAVEEREEDIDKLVDGKDEDGIDNLFDDELAFDV
jgi:hypothetical protein